MKSLISFLALSLLFSCHAAEDTAIPFNTPEADIILRKLQIFPADNAWNTPVTDWPVHPDSEKILASVGSEKPLRHNTDMSFVIIPPDQKKVPVSLGEYADESDPGPYPVPDNTPIEGWPASFKRDPKLSALSLRDVQLDLPKLGGDRHAIIVDPGKRLLWEFYAMKHTDTGWQAAQASLFDLKSNKSRPKGWTSSDAAGLPIFPAIVRYDELEDGKIGHALRVTIRKTRRAFVAPATHYASRNDDPALPRMGERFRLRADFNLDGFSPEVTTILAALKTYGMIVADNGLDLALSVAPDERIPELHEELRRVKGSDFEVVLSP